MVVGLDGKGKMSKSLNNHLDLALTPIETRQRIMTAVTDTTRRYRKDPGHPDVCNVAKLLTYFDTPDMDTVRLECINAGRGCVDCKGTAGR